ncbi:hypothetical protein COO60DRAFT_1705940 [Scenedesmus sp. NREL 46B-D3]|nr:hypothetical protein COO60DRAFT_1705940 [Scenedesmus sp. NREL 46B-D3]
MDEGGIDSREMVGSTQGPARRNSLAGMFPFLQKQPLMDTDANDRHQRRGMGGKIKPGKQHSRSSSGDVSDSATPGPGDVGSSAAWHAAAGHDSSSTTPQGWPSNSPAPSTSTSTPSRGLFSKLLSGKKKHKGSHSPTHVALPNSPPLASLSLGACSSGSQSPRSHSPEQLPDYTLNVGVYGRSSGSSNGACLPVTPPHHHRHAVDADRAGDDEADCDSCYSTPIGSEAMLSPAQDYGGDTLDLRHMVYDAHGDKSPMPMRQDLTEVFTPGFNELLQQAGGRLQPQEADTPQMAGACEEPTVALLTCDQLAQAGRMYDAPAMLLGPADAQQQRDSAAASRSSSRCNSSRAAGSEAVSRVSSAVTSPEPMQLQQHAGTAGHSPSSAAATGDSSEQQPLCTEDVELHVAAASACVEGAEVAAAAEEPSRPASPTPSRDCAADATEVASASALGEQAAAGVAEDDSTDAADVPLPQNEDSTPAAVAASTEGCATTAGVKPASAEAAEPSCSAAEDPAATEKQRQPEAVQEGIAVQESGREHCDAPARSSSSSQVEAQSAEEAQQGVPAAAQIGVETCTAKPAAEAMPEAAVSPVTKASPQPASVPAEADPVAEPAVEPAADATAEAAAEPAVAAAGQPASVPAEAEPAAEPAAEATKEAAVSPAAEAAPQPASVPAEAEPAAEPAAEAKEEAAVSPAAEAAPQPASVPAEAEPAAEPAAEATKEAAVLPAAEAAPQPASVPAEAEPAAEAMEEAAVSPAAEAAPQPACVAAEAEPAAEPAAEATKEAAAEPAAEAAPQPASVPAEAEPAAEAMEEAAVSPAAEAASQPASMAAEAEPAAEPAAEATAEAAVSPAKEAGPQPASVPAEAEPAAGPAAEAMPEQQFHQQQRPLPSQPPCLQKLSQRRNPQQKQRKKKHTEELVEDAAAIGAAPAAVGDDEDEFALLEQQVIAEVAEEVAVDKFALLEQQVAAEEAEEVAVDEFALLEQQVAAEEADADDFAELERLAAAEAAAEGLCRPSSNDSPVLGLTSSARRAARHSPMSAVRESMPLFLADPSRAMGSPLALQPGEESLDDQDMQQLSAGNAYKGSSGYGGTRLLTHGGPQRVSLGGSGPAGGSSFLSSLEPVEEASFTSAGSPTPEG